MNPTSTHNNLHNPIDVNSRCFVLTCVNKRSIISAVGCLPTKGGCCDNDGEVLNSRGGSNRTGYDSLFHLSIWRDRKSTRLNSSHQIISYAVFCLKKKKKKK